MIGVVLVSRGFSQVADPAWFTRRIAKQLLELVHHQHKRGLAKASDLSQRACNSGARLWQLERDALLARGEYHRIVVVQQACERPGEPGNRGIAGTQFLPNPPPTARALVLLLQQRQQAGTDDDFPLPELPTTAMKRLRSTRR